MYEYVTKSEVLVSPHRYAWNILLRVMQFTTNELLENRDYISLPEMIQFQDSVTMEFLRSFFSCDIDACLEVDWEDCRTWIARRC